jgi:hypothetical protein
MGSSLPDDWKLRGQAAGRQHRLCYRCHMMIHTREKNPEAWAIYKTHVAMGRIFHPFGKGFVTFCRETLEGKGEGVPFKQGPVRVRTLLDELT